VIFDASGLDASVAASLVAAAMDPRGHLLGSMIPPALAVNFDFTAAAAAGLLRFHMAAAAALLGLLLAALAASVATLVRERGSRDRQRCRASRKHPHAHGKSPSGTRNGRNRGSFRRSSGRQVP
jgi:hypothetical protein